MCTQVCALEPTHNRYDDGHTLRPHIKNGARPGDNIGAGMVWTTDGGITTANNNSHSNPHAPRTWLPPTTTPAGVTHTKLSLSLTQALCVCVCRHTQRVLTHTHARRTRRCGRSEACVLTRRRSGGGPRNTLVVVALTLPRARPRARADLESLEVEPANNMGAPWAPSCRRRSLTASPGHPATAPDIEGPAGCPRDPRWPSWMVPASALMARRSPPTSPSRARTPARQACTHTHTHTHG